MPARQKYFYPRSPCGERRNSVNAGRNPTHISIHALLAESDWYTRCRQSCRYISIHALLAESDFRSALPSDDGNISIHALLAESDLSTSPTLCVCVLFLSTLSLRRATVLVLGMPTSVSNFYPRSPCGERRSRSGLVLRQSHFYPRSPCGERHLLCMPLWWLSHFYPRSPCGERRCVAQAHGGAQWNFYPRSPCGERRRCWMVPGWTSQISIHALLAESDKATA